MSAEIVGSACSVSGVNVPCELMRTTQVISDSDSDSGDASATTHASKDNGDWFF